MEERARLTKSRWNTNPNKLTLEDMLLNSCVYDAVGNLTFWHLTNFENATDLIAGLYEDYDAVTEWDKEITADDVREILRYNLSMGLNTIDGLLANFYWLIDSNAKLRKRLKEYEDKEFGEEDFKEDFCDMPELY